MAMKNVSVLIITNGEQDSYTEEIVGVVTSKTVAHAFLQIGMFQTGDGHDVNVVTLDVLDAKLQERISTFLDPEKNPLCECGHRLLHHRRKGSEIGHGNCKWNIRYGPEEQRHLCKGFKLAKEQEKIEIV